MPDWLAISLGLLLLLVFMGLVWWADSKPTEPEPDGETEYDEETKEKLRRL